MSTKRQALNVKATPLLKRAIGHFAVEQDLTQGDALVELLIIGLRAHIADCGMDCALIQHMGDVIAAQALKELASSERGE